MKTPWVPTVYVDALRKTGAPWVGGRSCHLLSLDPEDLDMFARLIALPQAWRKVSNAGVPHYDLWPVWRDRALGAGAIQVPRHFVGGLVKYYRLKQEVSVLAHNDAARANLVFLKAYLAQEAKGRVSCR